MRYILVIFGFVLITSCHSNGEKKSSTQALNEQKAFNEDPASDNSEQDLIIECECPYDKYPYEGHAILRHMIGDRNLVVCGYLDNDPNNNCISDLEYDFGLLHIFDCSTLPIKLVYSGDGIPYKDKVMLKPDTLIIERLIQMPTDTTLVYNYLPVISTEILNDRGMLKKHVSFVFPYEKFEEEFLNYLKDQINLARNDSVSFKYHDLLLHYIFIMAVINPAEYAVKLKSPKTTTDIIIDGYTAIIYIELLEYYKLFEENKNTGG